MTDSEKLDLLLAEMQEMKTVIKDINQRITYLETGQAELKKKADKLAIEHARTQNEIYKISRKIEDTYGVALDALAATAENRKWLETGTSALI